MTNPKKEIPPEVLSPEEAASYLSISRRTFDRLMYSGEIPYSRVGSLPRVLRADLDAYLARTREERKRA